jgi:ABC-type sugar transport system substrate-binding protein
VSQKVDGIVIQGIPSAAISAELKGAKDAGIPVVMLFDQPDTGTPSPEQADVGVVGNVEICWSCEGKLMAAAAVAEKGEDVNSVFISAEELTSAVKQEKGYSEELASLCDSCTNETTYVPVAQWSTGIQGAVTTALSNPKVNVVAPVYDLMIPAAQAAMAAAQAQSRAILLSGDATITGVAAMAKDPSVKFMAGAPSEWAGWLAIDQWLRSENGQEPAADSVIPVRALTKQTIEDEDFDLSDGADETKWFTDINFEEQFSTLWGI